jgi:outer membrane protein TolC
MKRSTAIFRAVGLGLLALAATTQGATAQGATAQATAQATARETTARAAQETSPAADAPLTLDQVIERAQREGHSALAAGRQLEAARLRYGAFGANLLPRISLSGHAPRYNKSISPVVQPDGATVFVPRGEMETSLNLTMSQPIPFLGARVFASSAINRIDPLSAGNPQFWQSSPLLVGVELDLFRPRTLVWDGIEQELRLEVAERQFLEAREDGAARATNAFFDLYAAQLSAANARANATVNDSLYLISQGRYEVGKIAENDLLQSELAVLRARAAVDAALLGEEQARAALRLELNLPDGAPLEITPPPAALTITVDPEVAMREAQTNRSEVLNLELQQVQAERSVTTARLRNGFNARLTAGVGYNQTAPLFDEVYRSPLRQQSFGLQVEMPLVQWGAGRYEVAAARVEEERIAILAERSRRELAQEASFAARNFALAQSQLALAAKSDTVASRRFDVAKDRYVIGRIGIGELYIAQTEKDAALQAYVQAVRAYWLANYRLRRITLYDFQTGRKIVE